MEGDKNMSDTRKWALVLGASSGFGEATALKMAKEGFNVAGVHLDRAATMPNVERIKSEIEKQGVKALFFNINAADDAKRKEVLDTLENLPEGKAEVFMLLHSLAFGALRPYIDFGSETPLSKAQMEMTLDVMAHSLVYWTQGLFYRKMLARKARIFAMTSSGGHISIPAYGAVSAAKAALESHCRQLSMELGDLEVAVSPIMAGVTDTPALRKIPGNSPMINVAQRKNPRNRLTTPEDIAKIIALLCKDGGEWVSGGLIHADGGEDVVNFNGQRADDSNLL